MFGPKMVFSVSDLVFGKNLFTTDDFPEIGETY